MSEQILAVMVTLFAVGVCAALLALGVMVYEVVTDSYSYSRLQLIKCLFAVGFVAVALIIVVGCFGLIGAAWRGV